MKLGKRKKTNGKGFHWVVRYQGARWIVDRNGVRKRERKTIHFGDVDEKTAKKLFAELRSDYELQRAREKLGLSTPTADIDEIWDSYIASNDAVDLKESTLDGYRKSFERLKAWMEQNLGSSSPEKLTASVMESFIVHRRTSAVRGRVISGAAADRDKRHLKVIFNHARKAKLVNAGLFDLVGKRPQVSEWVPRYLLDKEAMALFNAADDVDAERGADSRRLGLFMRLGFFCGFRVEEIPALLFANVDYSAGTVKLTAVLELGFVPKKRRERIVPLTEGLIDLIRATEVTTDSPFLVGYQDMKAHEWRRDYEKMRDCAGLGFEKDANNQNIFGSAFVPRSLRHNFAMRFCQLTDNKALCAEIMGHNGGVEVLEANYLRFKQPRFQTKSEIFRVAWAPVLKRLVA